MKRRRRQTGTRKHIDCGKGDGTVTVTLVESSLFIAKPYCVREKERKREKEREVRFKMAATAARARVFCSE